MNALKFVVVALALVAGACNQPNSPSASALESIDTMAVTVTSIPPAGVTPRPEQEYRLSVSLGPHTVGVGMTIEIGFVFVRDDGVRRIDGCGGGVGGTGIGVWEKGHMIDLEILLAEAPISDVAFKRCLFAPVDPYVVLRERAQRIVFHPLGWRF